MRRASLIAFVAVSVAAAPAGQETAEFRDKNLILAAQLHAEGKTAEAIGAVRRAMERDNHSLDALQMLAELAQEAGDTDLAVHSMYRWGELAAHHEPPVPSRERKAMAKKLLELDPEAATWEGLKATFVDGLTDLAKDYKKQKDALGGLDVHALVLRIDPHNKNSQRKLRDIRRTGGAEVATEDLFAGTEPGFGKSPETIRREDQAHQSWKDAWQKKTTNYRIRTNAGYMTLETAAIALEQVNRFYRSFFRYKESGGRTPMIDVRIFKNREEYLSLGSEPSDWSAGQFTGNAVETFTDASSGEASIRSMYRTLFHEAAHQFVGLTGPSVPGWLNEAYASFFEGCVILSNGSVRWNRVPPQRLFPLVKRFEKGWASSVDEVVSEEIAKAPTLRMIVSGDYTWGPAWYGPTWGFIYFFYNYRHDDGRPIYRDALHDYYKSFKKGPPKDPVAHFEEQVLRGSELSPAQAIDDLDEVWRRWTLTLRDKHVGRGDQQDKLAHYAQAAEKRGDRQAAIGFYEEALEFSPDDVDLLLAMARAMEKEKMTARAAHTYRRLKRVLQRRNETRSTKYDQVTRKSVRLDPLVEQCHRLERDLGNAAWDLVKGYKERGLPLMALEIARSMSVTFAVPGAAEFYGDVARESGKSLALWRTVYDGESLDGWTGNVASYRADGELIHAHVDHPLDGENIFTQDLVCDVTFDADFSLEVELQIAAPVNDVPQGSWAGLCFGRKNSDNVNAVLVHPKGVLDIASRRGGTWEILDHRNAFVGHEWRTLRIDVTGRTLDVYLDGLFVRSLDFANIETVQGSFGLMTGAGKVSYRNLRLLARDRFDPAAAVERQMAMARIAEDVTLRQEGNFAGTEPPELQIPKWVQGEPLELAALRGKPVVLAFWTPAQDEVIPTAEFLADLSLRGHGLGLTMIVLCDGGTEEEKLAAYLTDHSIPGAHIGIDTYNETYPAYFITAEHHGIPRVLLLDSDGKVVFEGDPGLTAGVGWKPGTQTYVDAAFEKLLQDERSKAGK